MQNVNFKDDDTAKKINDWCSKNTHGLIKQIVSKDSIEECDNVITNALYFKGNWMDEFYKEGVTRETFLGTKEKTQVDMMHSTESIYLENKNAIGFMKYYYDNYDFVGILPKNEGRITIT